MGRIPTERKRRTYTRESGEAHGVCVQHTIKGFHAREWCGVVWSGEELKECRRMDMWEPVVMIQKRVDDV